MERPGTDETVSNILLTRNIYLTLHSEFMSHPNSFQFKARELMKIKVKIRLLFSSSYIKFKSPNKWMPRKHLAPSFLYFKRCAALCLQERQALSFNSSEEEIFCYRGGRAGWLPVTTQGGHAGCPVPHMTDLSPTTSGHWALHQAGLPLPLLHQWRSAMPELLWEYKTTSFLPLLLLKQYCNNQAIVI